MYSKFKYEDWGGGDACIWTNKVSILFVCPDQITNKYYVLINFNISWGKIFLQFWEFIKNNYSQYCEIKIHIRRPKALYLDYFSFNNTEVNTILYLKKKTTVKYLKFRGKSLLFFSSNNSHMYPYNIDVYLKIEWCGPQRNIYKYYYQLSCFRTVIIPG